jgi:DNA glycosylase AlkZ-like
VLLVGGRMEGVWRQEPTGRRLAVTIEPFTGPLPARARRAAEAEAERLAAWSGRQLELRWEDG